MQLGISHIINSRLAGAPVTVHQRLWMNLTVTAACLQSKAGLIYQALFRSVPWQFLPSHQVVFDWQKINYSEVKSIANPITNLMSAPLGLKPEQALEI